MRRIISFFLPKEIVFFDLFEKQAETALQTAEYFRTFLEQYDTLSTAERKRRLARIKQFENEGDAITGSIMENLHSTFITPIDHEDIHELAVKIDDAIDGVDVLAKKVLYYRLKKIPATLKKQIAISCEQLVEVKKEIAKLRTGKRINEEHKRIHALENIADTIHSEAMGELFDNHKDPIDVIKLKDLYENAEQLTDTAQHISIILDGIVIRNG